MDGQGSSARASEPTRRRHAPHVRDAATVGIGSGSLLPCHLHPEHRSMPGCLEPPRPSRTEEARRVWPPCAAALAKFTADQRMPRRAPTEWADYFLSLAIELVRLALMALSRPGTACASPCGCPVGASGAWRSTTGRVRPRSSARTAG